jgi:hypothetical protein
MIFHTAIFPSSFKGTANLQQCSSPDQSPKRKKRGVGIEDVCSTGLLRIVHVLRVSVTTGQSTDTKDGEHLQGFIESSFFHPRV